MSDKPHTDKQRNALHLWFRQCATVCQDAGYTLSNYVHDMTETGMELPITEGTMKEIFRAAYSRTTGYKSTEEASTTDYEPAYNALVLFFGQRGIQLPPFPDRFAQAEERQEHSKKTYIPRNASIEPLAMERTIYALRRAATVAELKTVWRTTVRRFMDEHYHNEQIRNRLNGIYLDRLGELQVIADNDQRNQ